MRSIVLQELGMIIFTLGIIVLLLGNIPVVHALAATFALYVISHIVSIVFQLIIIAAHAIVNHFSKGNT